MPTVVVETQIEAPVELCFDLARDIDIHCRTAASTRERAVAGVTSGLIGHGETVTFEAVHFGVTQRLTSQIVDYDRPLRFVDEMTQGAFQKLRHVHLFLATDTGTLMTDTLTWTAPLGLLGVIADKLFLERHMRNFLQERNMNLKKIAEEKYLRGER
jgi:ligand-binding SRPBCC domain-containing protein